MDSNVKYPIKPIKIIGPWAAGGSSDTLLRIFASIAEDYFGQPLVVVNRTGAGGTIATTEVKGAKPDGYTIMLNAVGVFTTQPKMRDVSYSLDDFETVIGLSYEPIVLTVHSNSNYKSLDDLKNAKKNIKYGSSGTGSLPHLSQAAFFGKAGIESTHIPYKGGAPAITALLGRHIDIIAAHPGELLPYVRSGDLLMLNIFSPERYYLIPDVPTFKEQGYDLDFSVWKFILTPKGVDPEIVKILHDKFYAMMQDSRFIEFAKKIDIKMNPISGKEVREKLTKQIKTTGETIDVLGLATE
ncbi:hypothetical protein ES708_29574 [subsurface metagenome]